MSINYFCKLFCKDEKCGPNKLVSEPRFEGFELLTRCLNSNRRLIRKCARSKITNEVTI
ncbi:hypothetical protein HanIR_Chr12g0576641 [Helianthus annuus]|nr:hypothetical protein HanIR_Chr12g0576641 [Helianthus annuus]